MVAVVVVFVCVTLVTILLVRGRRRRALRGVGGNAGRSRVRDEVRSGSKDAGQSRTGGEDGVGGANVFLVGDEMRAATARGSEQGSGKMDGKGAVIANEAGIVIDAGLQSAYILPRYCCLFPSR